MYPESFGLIFPGLDFSSVKWDSWALRVSSVFLFSYFFPCSHALILPSPGSSSLIIHPYSSPLSLETVLESFWHLALQRVTSSPVSWHWAQTCVISALGGPVSSLNAAILNEKLSTPLAKLQMARRASWPRLLVIQTSGEWFSFQTTNWGAQEKTLSFPLIELHF